ncbi:hypothetical protein [Conexibacter sp. SYSU D00693]|uniref:hypothetical protein n=1 Tax=Conexibacter sp. SYSU D00693 TaxID=2812560 RepID=UPI00196A4464|nr:hypothetical protein [Conexibacter sp. SYSU D00693]
MTGAQRTWRIIGVMEMRLRAALPVIAILAAPGPAGATPAPNVGTLRASADLGPSGRQTTSITLTRLLRRDFQVLRRTASSVTLGYPATETVRRNGISRRVRARPCARATIRLALVAGNDAVAFVRQALPTARDEGTVTSATSSKPLGQGPTAVGAWRLSSAIEDSSRLVEAGVAARPLRPGGLRVLSFSARMVRVGGVCGGTNTFTVGPGLVDTLLADMLVGT